MNFLLWGLVIIGDTVKLVMDPSPHALRREYSENKMFRILLQSSSKCLKTRTKDKFLNDKFALEIMQKSYYTTEHTSMLQTDFCFFAYLVSFYVREVFKCSIPTKPEVRRPRGGGPPSFPISLCESGIKAHCTLRRSSLCSFSRLVCCLSFSLIQRLFF